MAENEYLDSTKAQRWIAVSQAIRENRSIDEVTELVRDRFYKTLRNIRKDLPLSEIIESADDPEKLEWLFDDIHGTGDVKDFFMQASREETDRLAVLE